jgi:uncharacterized protein YjbI with pentapeptide repeats
MELVLTRPRRIAFSLFALLGVLAAVRLYYAFLMSSGADLQRWFSVHPIRPLLLTGCSSVTVVATASIVRNRLGHRLVIPLSMVVGALTTAMHTSLTGMVIGLFVGAIYTSDRLFRLAIAALRAIGVAWLPVCGIAITAGLLARMAQFAEETVAQRARLPIYVFAGLLAAWFIVRKYGPRRAESGPDTVVVGAVALWRRIWRLFLRPVLSLGVGAGIFALGILVGWQLDIYRRAAALERVGSVSWWSPMSPSDWLRGGLWMVPNVHLGASARDEHLKHLPGLPGLTWLTIESPGVTDAGCRHLARLRWLQYLRLSGTTIHDEGLRQLAGLPQLTTLSVRDVPITRDALPVLATLPRLDYVAFEGIQPRGAGLQGVSLATGLRVVLLRNCGITDEDMAALAKSTFLSYLDLSGNQIRGPGLRHLSGHIGLGTLVLNGNPLDDAYLDALPVANLNGIMMDGAPLTAAGCGGLMRQRWLQDVSLRESRITEDQLRRLISLPYLQDAQLDGTNLSPRSLIGWRQREVTIWVEHQTLEAADITRLGEIGPDVVLVDCELTPGAIAELANYRGVFSARECRTQARFEPILRRYAH